MEALTFFWRVICDLNQKNIYQSQVHNITTTPTMATTTTVSSVCSSYLSALERQFNLNVAGLLANPQVHLITIIQYYYYNYNYNYKQCL